MSNLAFRKSFPVMASPAFAQEMSALMGPASFLDLVLSAHRALDSSSSSSSSYDPSPVGPSSTLFSCPEEEKDEEKEEIPFAIPVAKRARFVSSSSSSDPQAPRVMAMEAVTEEPHRRRRSGDKPKQLPVLNSQVFVQDPAQFTAIHREGVDEDEVLRTRCPCCLPKHGVDVVQDLLLPGARLYTLCAEEGAFINSRSVASSLHFIQRTLATGVERSVCVQVKSYAVPKAHTAAHRGAVHSRGAHVYTEPRALWDGVSRVHKNQCVRLLLNDGSRVHITPGPPQEGQGAGAAVWRQLASGSFVALLRGETYEMHVVPAAGTTLEFVNIRGLFPMQVVGIPFKASTPDATIVADVAADVAVVS
jgi:hypothetical protein